MSSTKQYIYNLYKENLLPKILQWDVAAPGTQTPISLNSYQTKDCKSVPQFTSGQKPYESVHRLSRVSVNTN